MEDCIADCAEHYKLQIPKMHQVRQLNVLLVIDLLVAALNTIADLSNTCRAPNGTDGCLQETAAALQQLHQR